MCFDKNTLIILSSCKVQKLLGLLKYIEIVDSIVVVTMTHTFYFIFGVFLQTLLYDY